ncbi:MAG: response regulator [Phycisphaera sp.]|nr:response regulator [Phycisphaera sp.]
MATQHILVVEDDAAIRQGIVDALQFHGFGTFESGRGDEARDMAGRVGCDLILLDLVLPGCRGLEVLREVRKTRPTLPVIILTALGDEADRIRGLDMGADDYVVKPFSVAELLARVKAVLRRSPERPSDVTEVALPCGRADLQRREILYDDGTRVDLSEREAELLTYLAQNPGRAISRDEILQRVWRLNPKGVTTRTIDMHVVRLREKLRDDKAEPHIIRTVRGKGYMFGAESESE